MRSGGSFRRYLGMNKEKKEVVKVNQITEGVIWQQILIFFLPILFGTFFQQLYNTADAMIVGHFLGKQALAAVGGTTGTLINLLVGFLSAFRVVRRLLFHSITEPIKRTRCSGQCTLPLPFPFSEVLC